MTIDDIIVLAMAVPEERKDGRRTVCVAGYSPSLGHMVRLYPVRPDAGLHRWDIIRATVERNPQDSRAESWKLADSRGGWDGLNGQIRTVGKIAPGQRLALVSEMTDGCVHAINDERRSLGIVQAGQIDRAYFTTNDQHYRPHQAGFPAMADCQWVSTKRDYTREPRIAYHCAQCQGEHDQKVLDWGAYEWMRKMPSDPDLYWHNLRLFDHAYDLFLVVGNQQNQRTSFLVIGIIPLKTEARPRYGARGAWQPMLIDAQ